MLSESNFKVKTSAMTNRRILFACFLFLLGAPVFAQLNNESRLLKQGAAGYKLQYDANHSEALTKAKEKGWPLTLRGKDGKLAMLTGVDAF